MSWRRREPQPPAHILPLRERWTPAAPTGDATWLLSQVRAAAETRWPGVRIDAGATEAEALERLLAEVTRG